MQIHEYQAKELFTRFDIPVPKWYVATTVNEAVEKATLHGNYPVVVKAQIHAGGRGKAGGVKLAFSADEVRTISKEMLGATLVTKQTGPEGKKVHKLIIAEGVDIKKEIYLSLLVNRDKSKVTVIASADGGVEIEEVAEKTPEKIITVDTDPNVGLQPHHIRQLLFELNIEELPPKGFTSFMNKFYKMFLETDCMMAEINPLIITEDGIVSALDAKVDIDSNALIRHADILEYRDPNENHPLENIAFEHDINYINIDEYGSIGSMVNGAGLAMATMDSIKIAGGKPANFLDVGGGANSKMIAEGLKIIAGNKNVKGVFINIFGGILQCDTLAHGVIEASKSVDIPLIVRLKGTNAEEGRRLLRESGLNIVSVDGMKEGAEKAVLISNKG